MAFTAVHGARSSSVPSGDRSANPATYGVPGRSDLQRAHISVSSAQKRSGAEMLATASGVSRAASSAVSCRCAALITPEASLKRLVPLVDYLAAWKLLPNVSRWVLHTVERGYRIQFGSPPPRFNGVNPTLVGPEQALGMEREVDTLLRKGVRVLQPVLHSSKEGWRVASHFRSASIEPLRHETEVQYSYTQTHRVSDQVRGLVCHDRSKRRIFPCLHPSHSQEVPEVCFRGRSLPISGSSLRPSTLIPHFHEVCGCCAGPAAAPGHPHTQLYRRLFDFFLIV